MLFLGKTEALAVCRTARIGLARPPRQICHCRSPERSPALDSVSSSGWLVRAQSAFAAWNAGGSTFLNSMIIPHRSGVSHRPGPDGSVRHYPPEGFPPWGIRHKEQSMVLQKPADSSCRRVPALIISPAAAEATATTTTTTAGAREVRARRPSFIDGQGTALEGLSIQPCDCLLNVFALAEFDKAEASWRPCHLVANHHRRGHLKARAGYKLAERRIGSAMG